MDISKSTSLDITVTQKGDIYTVTGPGAAGLYAKMQQLPAAVQSFELGPLEDGKFSMRKLATVQKKVAGG